MAVISINYSSLEDSIKKANKTASYLDEYIKDMDSIAKDCDNLGGSDPNGYVSSAAELARQKLKRARTEKTAYYQLSTQLSELGTLARERDQAVETSINITVSTYIGKKSIGQAFVDGIYGLYMGFVNRVASLPVVGKHIAQGIRTAGNWISNTAVFAYNYFKYGDGKYIWNVVTTVASAIVAIASAVTAIVSVVTAAPALVVIAGAGAIAASVYAVLKFGDMLISVDQNIKALDLSRQYHNSTKDKEEWWDTSNDEGSITAARYYGTVSGIKDWADKTDFGGKTANDIFGVLSTAYEEIEKISQIASTIFNITVSFGNAQYVKNSDGTWVTRDGGFLENVQTAYLESVGYTYERVASNGKLTITGRDFSKAFKFQFFGDYGEKLAKIGINNPGFIVLLNSAKVIKEADGFISNIELFHDLDRGEKGGIGDLYDAYQAIYDIASRFEFIGSSWDVNKPLDMYVDISRDVHDIISPSENAFLAYMKVLEAR